jgi:hypothetical protein
MESAYHTTIATRSYVHPDTKMNIDITTYAPKYGSTVALFSDIDKLPLITLGVTCQDKKLSTCAYQLFNEKLNRFQYVFTKNDQLFEFIISNTRNYHVHVNIFECDADGKQTSHTQINKINVLNPYQTLIVKSYHNKQDKMLKFSCAKSDDSLAPDKSVRLSKEIIKPVDVHVGTYICVTVNPKLETDIDKLYKSTHWEPIDVFTIIQETKPSSPIPMPLLRRHSVLDRRDIYASVSPLSPRQFPSIDEQVYRDADIPVSQKSELFMGIDRVYRSFHSALNPQIGVTNIHNESVMNISQSRQSDSVDSKVIDSKSVMDSKVGKIDVSDEIYKVSGVKSNEAFDYQISAHPNVF